MALSDCQPCFSDGILSALLFQPSLLALIPIPDMFITPFHWVGRELFFIKFVEVDDLDRKPMRFRWVEDG